MPAARQRDRRARQVVLAAPQSQVAPRRDTARQPGRFARTGVDIVTVPPGAESFAYHAHAFEEEWLYVLSGSGVALVDGKEFELGAGDFLGFPAPSVPHLMINRGTADLVYLEGGERRGIDVIDYPAIGKRYLLLPEGGRTSFYELGAATHPYGPADD